MSVRSEVQGSDGRGRELAAGSERMSEVRWRDAPTLGMRARVGRCTRRRKVLQIVKHTNVGAACRPPGAAATSRPHRSPDRLGTLYRSARGAEVVRRHGKQRVSYLPAAIAGRR